MRLSKAAVKNHESALRLLEKDKLSWEERYYVLDNWREDARHMNGTSGAFFTPTGLARDLSIEVTGRIVVDLCAGIGSLALACLAADETRDITCIEINADYVEVGKKVLPEAHWICGDVFDYANQSPVFRFDCAVSNPPFGNVRTHKNTRGCFEYDLIELANRIARDGVFIVPQNILPFAYSGRQMFEKVENEKYARFQDATGIVLEMNCGIDTACHRDDWTITPPPVEIALGFRSPDDPETPDAILHRISQTGQFALFG